MDAWYDEDESRTTRERRMLFCIIVTVLTAFALIVGLILTVGILTSFGDIIYEDPPEPPFYLSITKNAVMNHLQQFETIAQQYSNSRSGYNASVEYVRSQLLSNTNFNVYQQYFTVSQMVYTASSFSQVAPVAETYEDGKDFSVVENSASGTVVNTAVSSLNSGGCLASNFDGFSAGTVAMISASSLCTLETAIVNAEQSGAVAVLIRSDISKSDPYFGELSSSTTSTIPVLGITYLLGDDLASGLNPTVSIDVEGSVEISYTSNLFADTVGTNDDSIIVIGSHLDSVPAGPGINDNGSGSAVNLELAIQTYKQALPLSSTIRFAWWGAEELGLVGSSYYVENLTPEEKNSILLNLNYDMLASSNFFRGVYNGSEAQPPIKESSTKIAQIYEEFWINNNLQYTLTEFNGRSDYGPFMDANITCGGLKTGSNGIKTMAEREQYGGFANAPHDTCYHQACDTIENVNQEMLMQNAQAAANILQILSSQSDLQSYLFG